MIGIVIVAHGGLAREYQAAVEYVVGPVESMRSVSIEADHDRTAKQAEIARVIDEVDQGDGVVVVTDMFGGSPTNLSLGACRRPDRRILYGANLPMLIKLAKLRRRPLDEAVAGAREAGRKYINAVVPDREE